MFLIISLLCFPSSKKPIAASISNRSAKDLLKMRLFPSAVNCLFTPALGTCSCHSDLHLYGRKKEKTLDVHVQVFDTVIDTVRKANGC